MEIEAFLKLGRLEGRWVSTDKLIRLGSSSHSWLLCNIFFLLCFLGTNIDS